MPPEVLHVLLIKLIRDQGGAVTVNVRELVDQTDATWRIAVRRGPGRGESTWTAERIDALARPAGQQPASCTPPVDGA